MASTRKHSDELKPVPEVRPDAQRRIDPEYDRSQDGSTPLETVSVKKNQERNVWPIIWAVTTVLMILIALYLILG